MADLETILNADWNTENTAKPQFSTAPLESIYLYNKVCYIEQIEKSEDYMDLTSAAYYDPASYDSYRVTVGSEALATTTAIVDEIRRICSQFTPSGDDKILYWEGGEWEYTPFWYQCVFVVFKKKSGATLVGL